MYLQEGVDTCRTTQYRVSMNHVRLLAKGASVSGVKWSQIWGKKLII